MAMHRHGASLFTLGSVHKPRPLVRSKRNAAVKAIDIGKNRNKQTKKTQQTNKQKNKKQANKQSNACQQHSEVYDIFHDFQFSQYI